MPPFLPRKRLSSSPPPERSPAKGKGKAVLVAKRRTLFDALDALDDSSTSRNSADHPKAVLAKLGVDDSVDESSLSSPPSSEPDFEDVLPPKRRKLADPTSDGDEDDDEDIEFEDVVHEHAPSTLPAPIPSGDLELKINQETRVSLVNPHNKKQGPTKIERQIRIATHQMHVQYLMWHNAVRNNWLCDKSIQQSLVKQLQANPSMQKYLDKWKSENGITLGSAPLNTQGKTNGKPKGKRKRENDRSRRDWTEPAQKVTKANTTLPSADTVINILKRLSWYWKQRFRFTNRGLRKLGYMSLWRLDEEIKTAKEAYDQERHGERIRDKDELRECAERCEGSRDLGAQLFVCLLRGLGMDARMVVSLQPIGFGWSKNEEAAERKEKKSAVPDDDDNDVDVSEDKKGEPTPERKKEKTEKAKPTTTSRRSSKQGRGRGSRNAPIDLSASENESDDVDSVIDVTPSRPKRGPSKLYEKDLSPNYWVEVFIPATNTFLPVDPFAGNNAVATNPDILAGFEPRGAKAEKAKQVTAYVVGFSSDGTAKDVTVRYLKRHMWPGKTKGFRIPVEKVPVYDRRGKVRRYEEFDWFKTVMSGYTRRNRTAADDLEDETDLKAIKPEKKEPKEGEETLQSYKSSAEFVLERHLKREEALRPAAKHVKLFTVKGKGDAPETEEKVFLRSDVVACKSVETWHKEGREPMLAEQPLKRVPYRAATINRKREIAEAEAASGGEKVLQGLYSREQTDWIIPPPIQNGVIPKNAFGNMDVYVPSMVPQGAVHIPLRSTMRICKKLGIDYAEAVTGFEFGSRMAIPIITGVVVAEENEEMVMEYWRKEEAERLRKEDEKRRKAALGMWRKFLMGLRIVQRVREEYGEFADENVDELNPWVNKNNAKGKQSHAPSREEETAKRLMDHKDEEMAGGFFLPGHEEEEFERTTFFPTRHEDEDDAGGGFIVEGHDDVATPLSTVSNKRTLEQMLGARAPSGGEDEAEDDTSSVQVNGKKKTPQIQKKTNAKLATKSRIQSNKGKGKGKRKRWRLRRR